MNTSNQQPQNKNVRCSIILDDVLLKHVREYMKREDRNFSSVVRLALKKLLDNTCSK